MTIYVSTGGYGQWSADITAAKLAVAGVQFIELSGGRPAVGLIEHLAQMRERVCFQVHNYFPPPSDPFVFNLGSLDEVTARRSEQHVLDALGASRAVGGTHYSFHAGFLMDPRVEELGKVIASRALFERKSCIDRFVERVHRLAAEAHIRGVHLMVENNVLSARNAQSFAENPLLMCDPNECREIMQQMPRNVGLLIDVAHLKVSAHSLGFDPVDMFKLCDEWIAGYHLSDNDGLEDSNRAFDANAWFWPHLRSDIGYYSIEVYGRPPESMPALVTLCESRLGRISRRGLT